MYSHYKYEEVDRCIQWEFDWRENFSLKIFEKLSNSWRFNCCTSRLFIHNKNSSCNSFAVIRCVSINEFDHEILTYWIFGEIE